MSFSGPLLYFFIFFLFMFFILFVPFTLRIKIHNLRDDNNIATSVKISLFRKINFLALGKVWAPEDMAAENRIYRAGHLLKRFQRWGEGHSPGVLLHGALSCFNHVVKAVYWHELTLLLRIGFADPALTGFIVGFSQLLCRVFAPALSRCCKFSVCHPRILISPSFPGRELKFKITLECSLVIAKLIYSMLAGCIKKKEVNRRWLKNILFKT